MAYKKPQIVAKSTAKKSYVAGCPAQVTKSYEPCGRPNRCELMGRK